MPTSQRGSGTIALAIKGNNPTPIIINAFVVLTVSYGRLQLAPKGPQQDILHHWQTAIQRKPCTSAESLTAFIDTFLAFTVF